jgi:hypothetical protein
MRVMYWIADRIVEVWLKACTHDDANVAADVLEGCADVEVKYCRRCGAVRPAYASEWRRPSPLWHEARQA